MKSAHQEVEVRLNILQGMFYAGCGIGAWCYDDAGKLFMSTAPHEEEYRILLENGGCLDAAIAKKDLPGSPCILTGALGLSWMTEWVHLKNGGRLLVLLGPAYLHSRSVDESLAKLDRKGLSEAIRRRYMTILGDVPVLHADMSRHYACMLHFVCYEENLSRNDIVYESIEEPEPEETGREVPENRQTSNDFERMVRHEDMMLKCLSEGTSPGESANAYHGELQDFHLKDRMRQVKDNLIIFTGVCARRAISSGVPLYIGKTMESDWVSRIEAARSIGDTSGLVSGMYSAFQKEVKRQKEVSGFSQTVRECMDYVRMNYTQPLTTEEIARHCGYAEYYLTRKFTKETGVKLNDFIRSVRLSAAKVMLITTKKDIQQISEELQFGSRSYFDKVFRREIGISPKQFRDSLGQTERTEVT